MDLSSLDATIHGYCYLGLAQSTHKAYKVAVNRFTAFCAKFNVVNPFPVDELLLCRFVASLAQEGLSPSTIKSYLAGVRNAQISKGLPEPDKACTMPRLKLLQAGVAKARATGETPSSRKQRLPITPVILNGILSAWVTPSGAPEHTAHDLALLRAAATASFFGFFRAGEITLPSQSAFDQRFHLAWGDVAADDGKPPSMIRIHLKRSKCDQLGKGVDVYLGRTCGPACPVSEMLGYIELRGPAPGPFFRFHDGSPLTKSAFVERVRRALSSVGYQPGAYAGHSFRIGAATAALEAGLEDSVIRLMGRWNSDAFHRYIRTPRDTLAGYSGALLRGRQEPRQ